MISASDVATKARWWLFKRISAVGWWICPEPHRSDLQAVSPTWAEIGSLHQRAEDAEADAVRLVREKMDMWERAFAAEKALDDARNSALEEAADYLELLAHNYDRISENVWLTNTAKRLYASFYPRYLEAASFIRSWKAVSSQPVDNSCGNRAQDD